MSPERLDPGGFSLKERHPTKESDCYALGMVVYEVLSGRVPFAPRRGPVVIFKVLGGERPERPQGEEGVRFTDTLWGMLEHCWKPQPSDRPGLITVLQCLRGVETGDQPDESSAFLSFHPGLTLTTLQHIEPQNGGLVRRLTHTVRKTLNAISRSGPWAS